MKTLDLANFGTLLGNNQVGNEILKMERERSAWMSTLVKSHSLADEMKKITGEDSSAVQIARQIYDAQRAQEESIRKMLDPLAHIRTSLLSDSATQRMLAEFSKPILASDHVAKLIDQATGANAFIKAMQASESSMEHARKILGDTSVSSGLQQMMKSFEEVQALVRAFCIARISEPLEGLARADGQAFLACDGCSFSGSPCKSTWTRWD